MERKTYIQPNIKVIVSLHLLDQEFGFGTGGGNAGDAPAKEYNDMWMDGSEADDENHPWKW